MDAVTETADIVEESAECELSEAQDTANAIVDTDADSEVDGNADETEDQVESEIVDSANIELSPQYIELFGKFEAQAEATKKLQSERDKLRAEFDKAQEGFKQEMSVALEEISNLKTRLGKIADPGFSYTEDAGFSTWLDAYNALGYEQARKQNPELYAQFMESKKQK